MLIENLAAAGGEPVTRPALETPVVKNFICHKHRQAPLRPSNRMLYLQTVPVSRRVASRMPKPALKQIPITDPKLIDVEAQRHRQRQTILKSSPISKRLRRDVQVIRRDRYVLSESESESHANTLVHGVADIAADAEPAENVGVNILRDRDCDLYIGPELVVGWIKGLC